MLINSNNCHPNNDIKNFQPLVGLRALVVDDDIDSCALISFFLESYGVKVMTAASVLEALTVIKLFEPNILVSDIAMPKIDGYSLIRKIRALDTPLSTIPAIAVTAVSIESGRALAFKSGFQAYLTKPFELDDLVKEIVKLLNLPLYEQLSL